MCFEDSNSIILTLLMKKLGSREVKYVAQDHIATQDLTASKWKLRDLTQEWVGGEVRRNERDKKNKKEKEKKNSVTTVYTKGVILKIERYILSSILFQKSVPLGFCFV